MELIIFAEISRTIPDHFLCSYILLLFLNQEIFFGRKWNVSENGYLDFLWTIFKHVGKAIQVKHLNTKYAKTKALQSLIFTNSQICFQV